ncbi:MAG TPA: hypothetical protein VH092_30930 [Urbifossiella sp.]|nr:hypothetical protein [Urbifossiella sp.]
MTEPLVVTEPAPAGTASDTVEAVPHPLHEVRAAAGRVGARRVHELIRLGKEYESEHGLTPGRQRLKQLIQLGRRYETDHGLAAPKPRRRRRGDAWTDFVAALARVVKPAYRQAVEQLAAALAAGPKVGSLPRA